MSSEDYYHGERLCFDPGCQRCARLINNLPENHEMTKVGALKLSLYSHLISRNRITERIDNLKAEVTEAEELVEVYTDFVTNLADRLREADQDQRLRHLRSEIDSYNVASNSSKVKNSALEELTRAMQSFPNDNHAELAKSPEELFGPNFPLRGVDFNAQENTSQDERHEDDVAIDEVSFKPSLQRAPSVLFDAEEFADKGKGKAQERKEDQTSRDKEIGAEADVETDDGIDYSEISFKDFLRGRRCALFDPDEDEGKAQERKEGQTLRDEQFGLNADVETDDDIDYAAISLKDFMQGRRCAIFDADEPVGKAKVQKKGKANESGRSTDGFERQALFAREGGFKSTKLSPDGTSTEKSNAQPGEPANQSELYVEMAELEGEQDWFINQF